METEKWAAKEPLLKNSGDACPWAMVPRRAQQFLVDDCWWGPPPPEFFERARSNCC